MDRRRMRAIVCVCVRLCTGGAIRRASYIYGLEKHAEAVRCGARCKICLPEVYEGGTIEMNV